MARKPRTLPNANAGDPGAAGAVGDLDTGSQLALLEDESELAGLLEQFGAAGGYRVHLERFEPRALAGYCGTHDLTGEFLATIRTTPGCGGGYYGGRVVNDAGYVRRIKFRISGAPLPEKAAAIAAPPAPAETATDTLLRSLLESQREMIRELRESRNGDGKDSLEKTLALAKALKDLANGDGDKGRASEMLAVVDRVMGLRERILADGGGGGESSDFQTVVRDGIRPLLQLGHEYLATRRATMTLHRTGAPADPVAAIAQRIPAAGRAFLARKAKAGADPSLYAEMALDQLAAEDHDALKPLLEAGDFAARLSSGVEEWAPYGDWFAKFSDAMRELLGVTAKPGAEVKPIAGAKKKTKAVAARASS
jgi:hypothetical protein